MALGLKALWARLKAAVSHEFHANMSPMRASLSLALGILVGFSPFYGLHTPIVIGLAFLLRLNRPLAIVAASTTILPFVPFWIAGGVFMGRLVISKEHAGHLVGNLRSVLPDHIFDSFANVMLKLTNHLPLFNKASRGGQESILSAFMQWFIGCCVLAIVGSIVTFVISYFIFSFIRKQREKRAASSLKIGNKMHTA